MVRRHSTLFAALMIATSARAQAQAPPTPDPSAPGSPAKSLPVRAAPQKQVPPSYTPAIPPPVPIQYRLVPVEMPAPPLPMPMPPPIYTMQPPAVQVQYAPPVQQTLFAGPATTSTRQVLFGAGPLSLSLSWVGHHLVALGQPRIVTWTTTRVATSPPPQLIGQATMTTVMAPQPVYQQAPSSPAIYYQAVPVPAPDPAREAVPPPPPPPQPSPSAQSNTDAVHRLFGRS